MVRVLWFHPRQVLPPRGGGDLRTSGLLRGVLAAGHEVLFVQPDNGLPSGPVLAGAEFVTVDQWHAPALAVAKVLSRSALRSPRLAPSARARTKTRIARFRPQVAIVSEVIGTPVGGRTVAAWSAVDLRRSQSGGRPLRRPRGRRDSARRTSHAQRRPGAGLGLRAAPGTRCRRGPGRLRARRFGAAPDGPRRRRGGCAQFDGGACGAHRPGRRRQPRCSSAPWTSRPTCRRWIGCSTRSCRDCVRGCPNPASWWSAVDRSNATVGCWRRRQEWSSGRTRRTSQPRMPPRGAC